MLILSIAIVFMPIYDSVNLYRESISAVWNAPTLEFALIPARPMCSSPS